MKITDEMVEIIARRRYGESLWKTFSADFRIERAALIKEDFQAALAVAPQHASDDLTRRLAEAAQRLLDTEAVRKFLWSEFPDEETTKDEMYAALVEYTIAAKRANLRELMLSNVAKMEGLATVPEPPQQVIVESCRAQNSRDSASPMDCDFPFCGCFGKAYEAVQALREIGWKEPGEKASAEVEQKPIGWLNPEQLQDLVEGYHVKLHPRSKEPHYIALYTHPAPTQWRPIETAPKDGTEIDLWVRHITAREGGYRIPNAFYEYGEWVNENGFRIDHGAAVVPTHWASLSEPPK